MTGFLFVTLGSWGDLFPFIGIAEELRARGHATTIAASPAWRDAVNDTDVAFLPIGEEIGFDTFKSNPEVFRRMPFGLRAALDRFVFAQSDELTADLRTAMEHADVVVAHPAHVVAQNLAEALDKPVVIASVFPAMIPSAHTVPGGSLAGPWQGRLGRAANLMSWANARVVVSLLFDRKTNRHRRSLGLPSIRSGLLTLPLQADKILLLCPPELIDPPPDWPGTVVVTGSVTWDSITGEIDADLQEFLDAGEDPVLVTLGASSSAVSDDFFDLASATLDTLHQRSILITGPAPAPRRDLGSDTILRQYVSFDALLRRCRAIVHHGGVGTAVAAARAGIPQVVVPRGFDQPDTAALIERQGLGIAVPWRRRGQDLEGAVARILNDPGFTSRARSTGASIQNVNGALHAAEHLEDLSPEAR